MTTAAAGVLGGDILPSGASDRGEETMTGYKETLRRLALSDEGFMESELGVTWDPRAGRVSIRRPTPWSV